MKEKICRSVQMILGEGWMGDLSEQGSLFLGNIYIIIIFAKGGKHETEFRRDEKAAQFEPWGNGATVARRQLLATASFCLFG